MLRQIKVWQEVSGKGPHSDTRWTCCAPKRALLVPRIRRGQERGHGGRLRQGHSERRQPIHDTCDTHGTHGSHEAHGGTGFHETVQKGTVYCY